MIRGNVAQRNNAYLKLAELAFVNKDYRQAYNFYDSVRLDDPELKDIDAINAKKDDARDDGNTGRNNETTG